MQRWWWRGLGVGLGILALAGSASWAVETLWFRATWDRGRQEIDEHRYGAARARLAGLRAWWAGRGEVDYWMGLCEQAAGRTDAALAAWARVPRQSPFANQA